MSIFSSIVKGVYKVADPLLTTLAHPIQVTKAIVNPNVTVKDVQNQFFSQPKSSQITQTITAGLNYGLALGGVGAVATKGVAAVVGKVTLKKVVGAGGLVVAEKIINNSPKTQKLIYDTPEKIDNFANNISTAIETPSLKSGLRILEENPFLSGTALIALLTSLGFSTALIATLLNTRAINENSEVKQDNNPYTIVTDKTDNPNANSPIVNVFYDYPKPIGDYPKPIEISRDLNPIPVVAAPPSLAAPTGNIINKKAKPKPKKKAKTRRSKKKTRKNVKKPQKSKKKTKKKATKTIKRRKS